MIVNVLNAEVLYLQQTHTALETAHSKKKNKKKTTTILNYVSSQCARGKSNIAGKPEVHSKFF